VKGKEIGAFSVSPFICDYGTNIRLGDNTFLNIGCVILDEATVTFGNNVFIGPQCGFYTAIHPIDAVQRNKRLETARPICVGDNVWIGGHGILRFRLRFALLVFLCT